MDEMFITKVSDYTSFYNFFNSHIYRERKDVESLIAKDNNENENWFMYGYCSACRRPTKFFIDWKYSNNTTPNFRERLYCENCELNNRQRFTAWYMDQIVTSNKISSIYMYEQVTPFFKAMSEYFSDYNIIGSEYLGYDKKSGEIISGIRHEDALDLSFKSNSIDIIVSNDVFEHVPDIEKSFRESSRVLKDDGHLLFSIPFYHYREKTSRRANLNNGDIQHIESPQYHGNPIDPDKGSLVFYDFGWDIIEICKNNGFHQVDALLYHSFYYGHLSLSFMFVAKK